MLLAACASSQQTIQTVIAKTQAAWTPTPTTTFTPTLTRTPIPTPTSTAAHRPTPGVLYYDDFSNKESGWSRSILFDESIYQYFGGQYEIINIKTGNYYGWTIANRSFSDAVLTVDTSIESGNGEQGGPLVIWRHVDTSNFYMLHLTGSGSLSIYKQIKDDLQLLYGYTFSDAINQGQQINKIAISFIGEISKIYINGKYVTSIQDSTFITGEIGLGAASNESSEVKVSFDNLVVYAVDSWTPPK